MFHGKKRTVNVCATVLLILLITLMLTVTAGCENTSDVSAHNSAVAQTGDESDTESPSMAGATAGDAASGVSKEGVAGTGNASKYNTLGIDLTAFDKSTASTVAHEIFENQVEYLGTTIKLKGHYESADNNNTGTRIHSVVVSNEAGCCQPVFEFIWEGEHEYPKDYPKEFSEIEVEGTLKTYEEQGTTYYYLAVDDVPKVS